MGKEDKDTMETLTLTLDPTFIKASLLSFLCVCEPSCIHNQLIKQDFPVLLLVFYLSLYHSNMVLELG